MQHHRRWLQLAGRQGVEVRMCTTAALLLLQSRQTGEAAGGAPQRASKICSLQRVDRPAHLAARTLRRREVSTWRTRPAAATHATRHAGCAAPRRA